MPPSILGHRKTRTFIIAAAVLAATFSPIPAAHADPGTTAGVHADPGSDAGVHAKILANPGTNAGVHARVAVDFYAAPKPKQPPRRHDPKQT